MHSYLPAALGAVITCLLYGAAATGCQGCAAERTAGSVGEPTVAAGKIAAPDLEQLIERLTPLHTPLGRPEPGDWLAEHRESGQTYAQYRRQLPVTARGKRRVIYILPIGGFAPAQQRVADSTAELMGIYFGLPVRALAPLAVGADWPARARRLHPSWGDDQLLTPYILDDVLEPRLPDDGAVLLGLTAMDLWPGRGWNFVFGQASLRQRVGVWSIYRNGDPAESDAAYRLALLRTLKTATHETGHMFSMKHCTAYECNMCGSNHRDESDRRPIGMCPECLAKLVHATGVDPAERFTRLEAYYRREGLVAEAASAERSLEALTSPPR